MLGLALHPDFENNNWIYLYYTYRTDSWYKNRVVRYVLAGGLQYEKIIIDNIPGSSHHDGGRIAFGPDGFLYVSTSNRDGRGDVRKGDDKILRIDPKSF